jgi:Family of unknown function (DUF5678)
LKPYEHQWVALTLDYRRVVAHENTLKEAIATLNPYERETVILHKVLPFHVSYAPFFHA